VPVTAPAAAGSSPGGPPRCHTAQLAGSLATPDAGAGQRHLTLVLRNTGTAACTVTGYGGLALADAGDRPLPTRQVRVPDPAPATVTLHPGGQATAVLHWTVIATAGTGDAQTGDCQPTPATLRVIPPDETAALSLPWTYGPVCGGGEIDQQAYRG
jgi:hypothetical protein